MLRLWRPVYEAVEASFEAVEATVDAVEATVEAVDAVGGLDDAEEEIRLKG